MATATAFCMTPYRFGSGTVCNVEGEGGTSVAVYGGNDPADDSGSMRYVRIAEGGLVAGPNNEVNGLTLQGVGHGTTLEFIQVHNNLAQVLAELIKIDMVEVIPERGRVVKTPAHTFFARHTPKRSRLSRSNVQKHRGRAA